MKGSVAVYLLSEAKSIAGGSINKFLRGKSYNSCRCGILLLTTAMDGLNLERFIEDVNIPSTKLLQELKNQANEEDMPEVPSTLQDMVKKYDLYMEETLNRKMAQNAQFLMTYAKIFGLIQLMQHAVKINDLALYSFAHFEVTSVFFMTNHPIMIVGCLCVPSTLLI